MFAEQLLRTCLFEGTACASATGLICFGWMDEFIYLSSDVEKYNNSYNGYCYILPHNSNLLN
ncbi:hypothetical protein HMPREF1212_01396 [Parabacteroides sp. HGS0025]|nr:hypothetical protein HMPREF1212_01396 [Parabacteroides sp. HGS0025]